MLPLRLIGFVLLPAVTYAIPTTTCTKNLPSAINSLECKLVNGVVTSLKAVPTASSFCSSFLHIPTITTTKTATVVSTIPTTVTSYTSTATLTTNNVLTTTRTISTLSYTSTSTTTVAVTSTAEICNGASETRTIQVRGVLPSRLASFASAQISTACKCLGIPTPTKTVTLSTTIKTTSSATVVTIATASITQTSTATAVVTVIVPGIATTTVTVTTTVTPTSCPAPPTCGNQGIQFAVYQNPYIQQEDSYPDWDPEDFKTASPEYQGVTPSIGTIYCLGHDPDTCTIYDQYTRLTEYFAVNHRGWLYAGQTGTYTFIAPQPVDNIAEFWIGNKAYSGWTRDNADFDPVLETSGNAGTPNNNVFQVQLTAGNYYAIRVMFGQAGGYYSGSRGASLYFQALAPDGTDLNNTPYLMQYSCDGIYGPGYAPFGEET